MRVLHLYSGNLYGGIETLLVTLARYQHSCPTLEHHFALCFEGRLSRELEDAGATVHRLGRVRVRNPFSILRARKKLREILRQEAYDAVVCHSAWPQAIFGKQIKKTSLPLLFWLHGSTTGKYWLERWASCTEPDLALCNSKFTASSLRFLYPLVQSEILYLPVVPPVKNYSEEERCFVRDELQTPHNSTVIIQVSRMEDLKGHSLHLESLAMLQDLDDWHCWMVGGAQRPQEQRYQMELQKKAAKLGISDRVHFPGQRSDVPRLLASADIHCQPNTTPEGFGITFIEGMYAGLPIVTTNIGAAGEIIDSTCGVLVSPSSKEQLAEALRTLIMNRDQRLKLGTRGRARAAELCEPQKQMEQLERIFIQRLLNKDAA